MDFGTFLFSPTEEGAVGTFIRSNLKKKKNTSKPLCQGLNYVLWKCHNVTTINKYIHRKRFTGGDKGR